ncbi:MAG: UbiD family decarboxylase [Pigmentiphaga sp.]|uniref:UbiD family decarboxylase n=1 Tax=Pigmentiphaga sp. TaxID=1977564 RepID=UPI0029A4655A|nr:UbiD family decarboxylase [Pigmentiphaga sp.]MDX3907638.1 UbiD family decarboxylase [Pigmentiphaga sp.]
MKRDLPNLDLDRFRLKRFLDSLRELPHGADEIEIRSAPTRLADVASILHDNPRAVLFEKAGASGYALVGNALASRTRMAHAFGVAPRGLLPEILKRLRGKPEFVEISREQAPVQEVVMTGDDIDLTTLPINLQHELDGGPYISAAVDFAHDQASGWTNIGLRRLMIRGRKETGIDLVAPSDLRVILLASLAQKKHLPLSIVVGSHPIDYFAATMRLPVDELGLMAQLRGAPLPVVKSLTNDLMVPADAEWVIEGYLDAAGYTEPEGPYGEFLGYYGGVKINPVLRVTAITRRKDAIFQTLTIGGNAMSRTDTAQLCALRTEVLAWRALESAVREVKAIYAPPATGGVYNLRIALQQRVPGEARNAIAAVFASVANVKNVFVVDPDIDIFSDEQIEWAMGTRFQPERDLVVQGGFRTLPLDPSLDEAATTGSKAGFDLTWSFGSGGRMEATTPVPPKYEGQRFESVRAALADGPKFFEQLMAAVGSEDGGDVVRALEDLRNEGVLARDTERGRYRLQG